MLVLLFPKRLKCRCIFKLQMKAAIRLSLHKVFRMKTIVVEPREAKQSKLVMTLMKELNIPAKLLSTRELEDEWMARMIDEGMKENGEVPSEKIRAQLRK